MNLNIGKIGVPIVEDPVINSVDGWHANYWVPYRHALKETELGRQLLARLKEDGRVKQLQGKMISRGGGGEAFSLEHLGLWFLWRANLVGLDVAQEELENFLTNPYVEAISALWITGLEVEEEITLVDDIRLVPASMMPETQDRASFMGFDRSFGAGIAVRPRAALIATSRIRSTMGSEPTEDGTSLFDKFMSRGDELFDISLLINACKGVFCLPHYSTSYLPDSSPFGPFSGSGGGHGLYDVVTHGSVKAGRELGDQVSQLYGAFKKSKPDQKTRFRTVLDRLSQAKRRHKLEDKVLDLGITLEMLLLRDNSNKDQLSQSFRLRGSWLLGETPERRKAIFRDLKDLYSYRSEVAHGGLLSSKSRGKAANQYRNFESIAEDACSRIICGGEPVWEELLLGAI